MGGLFNESEAAIERGLTLSRLDSALLVLGIFTPGLRQIVRIAASRLVLGIAGVHTGALSRGRTGRRIGRSKGGPSAARTGGTRSATCTGTRAAGASCTLGECETAR
jgi:hypothetical protein